MAGSAEDKQNGSHGVLRLGYYTGLLAIAWTVIVGVSLAWNLSKQHETTVEAATIQARAAFEKDVLYRQWNAMHGGVYVPVTKTTPPNPYLKVPERDIETPCGRALTKINPAFMTRQVHELGAKKTGVQGHITSLDPIRPENAADPWETKALRAFENGAAEYASLEVLHGANHIRLMRPLVTAKGCLKCHAVQGYEEGDIRGGISVSIPLAPFLASEQAAMVSITIWHGVFWLLGVGGIFLSYRRLRVRVRERNQDAAKLEATVEQLEVARQDAEAASRSKSEFLANMSHEIRTPMTAILGYADILHEELWGRTAQESVVIIQRNGDHLLQIINDILDISKIEAGKLDIECIGCSPVQVVADVQSLMRVRADAKNLSFNIEFIGVVPETIQSDPTRLKQILVNLIGNAIKFTEAGGVRLVTRFVDTDPIGGTGPAEPMMQFDVIDTGIGLTEEQAGKLFQAFSQADASTTRKFGGTGLGLNISKRLSEMLGGDIVIESKIGDGSTFRVTVTTGSLEGVKMLENPNTSMPDESEPAGKTKPDDDKLDCRILLAEDGPDNQRLISHILKKAGAEMTVKENGKLTFEAALAARDEGNPFDVILMDMQMPVMDGYEATGQLRQQGYTGPIIALTAHAMASDRQKCIDAGCDDYETKPINRKKLIATIQEQLQRPLVQMEN